MVNKLDSIRGIRNDEGQKAEVQRVSVTRQVFSSIT